MPGVAAAGGFRGLQGAAGGCRGLQGAAGGCRGLQGAAGGCRGLQGDAAVVGAETSYRPASGTTVSLRLSTATCNWPTSGQKHLNPLKAPSKHPKPSSLDFRNGNSRIYPPRAEGKAWNLELFWKSGCSFERLRFLLRTAGYTKMLKPKKGEPR